MKKILLIFSFMFFSANSYAIVSQEIPGETFSYLFDFYEGGELLVVGNDSETSQYLLSVSLRLPLYESAKNWTSIIDGSAATGPLSYTVLGIDNQNAAAASLYVNVSESVYKKTMVNARINGLTVTSYANPAETSQTDGLMMVSLGMDANEKGWQPFDGFHSLYQGRLADLNSAITHEIMHSLGIANYASQYFSDQGDKTYYFSRGPEDSLGIFDKDFRIYQGNMADPFDSSLEIAPEREMTLGEGQEFDIIAYSPYYVGEETIKVLGENSDYDAAKTAIINNGGFLNYSSYYDDQAERPHVYGMPIHPTDGPDPYTGEIKYDIGHLELHNSYMSHQSFRNWIFPMEAELAVLKDLGYDIDLRRHFGKSYYLDGTTDTFTGGYSEWNGTAYTGNPSDVIQGIGLHIYGNDNDITQASDIKTIGDGSFGVRIDGSGNQYTLQDGSVIQADGKNAIGLAADWGKGHTITLEENTEITTEGENGIAVSFDFGGNLLGDLYGSRGSFFNYDPFNPNADPDEETQGALVEEFNVSGTLTGEQAAIYIAENAWVKDINILDGAEINGDIISEWNSYSVKDFGYIKKETAEGWEPINIDDDSEIHFTNLNIDGGFDGTISGNISGENDIFNTLILNSSGTLSFGGSIINVNRIFNSGSLTVDNAAMAVQNGSITGNGTINVNDELTLYPSVDEIENTVNLAAGANFSTINDEIDEISIHKLNSVTGKLSFDLGDTLVLENDSDAGKNTAEISQIKANYETASTIEEGDMYQLFGSAGSILDLGESSAYLYYGGKKWQLTQYDANQSRIRASLVSENVELGDAAEDPTAANYIVTEEVLTKPAGTVHGEYFEITGNDINAGGQTGLVIDGTYNPNGTDLQTGIYGTSGSALAVQNGGNLSIDAETPARDLNIGNEGGTAISINNGSVELNAGENNINVLGSINGVNSANDNITTNGNDILFNGISNVTANLNATANLLKGQAAGTIFNLNHGALYVDKDENISGDGTNSIYANGGAIALANGKASDIHLAQLTMNQNLEMSIDVDFDNQAADRFVFQDSADLTTNSHYVNISGVNLIYGKNSPTANEYRIPVAGTAYNSQNLISNIFSDFESGTVYTPIFKYNARFENSDDYVGFTFTRESSKDYKSYNPAVLAAPVSALTGGTAILSASAEQSFAGLDSIFEEIPAELESSLSDVNQTANEENIKEKGDTIENENVANDQEQSDIKPSKKARNKLTAFSSFGKIPLKNGPEADFRLYGADIFLAATERHEIAHGWETVSGYRAAFNMASQKFDGNKIYQPGAMFGMAGMAYKNGITAAWSANVGASQSNIDTPAGSEDFAMVMGGMAGKAGYGFKLRQNMSINAGVQMSYSLAKAFDYTNSYGVRIKTDPLHSVSVQPEITLSLVTDRNWVISAGAARSFSYFGETKFNANDVSLPDFSMKAYSKYSLGASQNCGKDGTFTLKGYITEGGIKGYGIQADYSVPFGGKKK